MLEPCKNMKGEGCWNCCDFVKHRRLLPLQMLIALRFDQLKTFVAGICFLRYSRCFRACISSVGFIPIGLWDRSGGPRLHQFGCASLHQSEIRRTVLTCIVGIEQNILLGRFAIEHLPGPTVGDVYYIILPSPAWKRNSLRPHLKGPHARKISVPWRTGAEPGQVGGAATSHPPPLDGTKRNHPAPCGQEP